ncbi:MAG TPA: hypothetical protein VMY39_03495, partial [Planctomycetota bacterium]|nr:hypothetical protein [Planctomycetota bacterium]
MTRANDQGPPAKTQRPEKAPDNAPVPRTRVSGVIFAVVCSSPLVAVLALVGVRFLAEPNGLLVTGFGIAGIGMGAAWSLRDKLIKT